jgi:hypothetical protein
MNSLFRHFYEYEASRPLEEMEKDILAMLKEMV